MQLKMNRLANLATFALCAIFTLGLVAEIKAQDKKADPTGTWTWTRPGRNGGPDRKITLQLKLQGDKLTGKVTSPGRNGESQDTEIKDGKVKGDEVSFTVVREFNGNTMTSKYNGKVSDNTIKGKISMEGGNNSRTMDWEAKKAPAAK
jgi:hypothetical protein